ncbi:MAG: tRNA 2-thiouridine(34) synthase MnmA [Candidatus Moranbacteria bacterium CG_4_9_14_3_um_filter_40_7]|nr:MAG: tRNA 2-thiouridine(34) synthase MnmA [Candidatus Moranbacteria bacterium CG06_land_8_20_14_3_00_40_12]PJA87461.1 MAG: tRNA 2-thiouridine(34) synthase MnmA [Candidatus Moranbacteria bacterium CG_4_9_14_3_um_filter_40_7]
MKVQKKKLKKRLVVAVGISGGVDSTMAAYLLKQQGYDVIGVTMKIRDDNQKNFRSGKGVCYGPGKENDIQDGKRAMEKMAIKHQVVDLAKEYNKYILAYFKKKYLSGQTPNPCVICNQKLKFGFLLKKIIFGGIKFDYFATGHYARIKYDQSKKRWLLLASKDERKDQSYFLYRLKQNQLRKTIFPLGELKKEEVKKLAVKSGFGAYAKKAESQDFIEGDNYDQLFGASSKKPGKIVDEKGKTLGRHQGIHKFTIGQRKGLNLGGLTEPYYVLAINRCENKVVAGKKSAAYADTFFIRDANWIAFSNLNKKMAAEVKVRSSQERYACDIIPEEGRWKVILKKPQFAITSGQSAVFYQKDLVLGGGIISLK